MDKSISPTNFFNLWKNICYPQSELLCLNWSNPKMYSSIILDNKNSPLIQISKEFGLKLYREYYMLDAVFYSVLDTVPCSPLNSTWLKRIRIAVEHENNIYTTYQEMSHLLITNCDLRVIITYPEEDENVHLKQFQDIMMGSRLSQEDSMLIIFGWKESHQIIWEGYDIKSNGQTIILN